MKINYSVIGFTLLIMILLMSCKDDDPHIDTTVVTSLSHHIQVTEDDNNLQIKIEVLQDTTDDRMGDFPNADFISIYIDRNANGIIDDGIDWGLGILSFDEICTFLMIDSMAVSGCGLFESDATLSSDFAASSLSSDSHIIWNISIPKDDLQDDVLKMVVKTFSNGVGYQTFPRENINQNTATVSFDKVLTVNW